MNRTNLLGARLGVRAGVQPSVQRLWVVVFLVFLAGPVLAWMFGWLWLVMVWALVLIPGRRLWKETRVPEELEALDLGEILYPEMDRRPCLIMLPDPKGPLLSLDIDAYLTVIGVPEEARAEVLPEQSYPLEELLVGLCDPPSRTPMCGPMDAPDPPLHIRRRSAE